MSDILFLAHRVPYPPDRGDKIRGFNVLKFLAARKRVHLVAFADDRRDMGSDSGLTDHTSIIWRGKSRAVAALQAMLTNRPVSLAAFDDDAVRAAVSTVLTTHDIDTIYVFSSQMAQYVPTDTTARVVMDFVDMDSAKFAGYGRTQAGPMGWLMRREGRLLGTYEAKVAARADASLFVSDAEAALFRDQTGAERVFAIENGIDTDTFDPDASFVPIDLPPRTIVFTGQMDYRPNVEAVTWFADEILPLVRKSYPDAGFAIVGRAPTDAVKALGKRPGILVTGEVTDVRGWLAAAAAIVAPLKLARGVQNKVLEAMAMARPIVASAPAAEGIDHADTIAVGETAEEIATQIIAILSDPDAARVRGMAARRQVMQRYGWDARLSPLTALLAQAIGPRAHRDAA
ncbi:TIGR03087 family PEP-CTERM/XrtA system glycosyltransferase [Sphingomonas aliaeris]|uniref:TIGR03087 family PEP-CTERM/XrtA system glycosyltransferase n=1 Tax=Sphingomonas aliaeris TaxID=2759526 RepID=A0A974S517_9SPHN|nr:TIGR03087 family PEP-CTERM/XrtA system glycosyltransferase [Sphingomonas aliaeris]QQV78222.1 TIGR03087 family PEP-CTERM/XrtA system glycosyltransferase [Sphingomonas aliaeris]